MDTPLDNGNQQKVQFEDESYDSVHGFNSYQKTQAGMPGNPLNNMNVKKKSSLLLRIPVSLHLVKNEKQAEKLVVIIAAIILIIAIFFIRKALIPAHVVQIRFTK